MVWDILIRVYIICLGLNVQIFRDVNLPNILGNYSMLNRFIINALHANQLISISTITIAEKIGRNTINSLLASGELW